MTYINLPQDQQRAISAVDMRALDSAIDRCVMEERISPLYEFGLRECGEHVGSELEAFERAMAAHNKAKAFAKREQTKADLLHAGRDLAHAVAAMKDRVETEQEEGQLFRIDDQMRSPFHLSNRLTVSIDYSWRSSPASDWARGQITFIYAYSPLPDYSQPLSKRKPSKAKAARDHQDELYRQWEYLKGQALCAVRDFFRQGGTGHDIPEALDAKPDPYSGTLNNFSCRFWQPA
ncbi:MULTISPECIES: hypothetical protein [unclassified Pseudomonas]|uniref:hypothetical protein n=1 Tax=unclassified Pseudomonas TaxID=196821 RepID=UPI00249C7A81|nr:MULTISPECIES: hypothetical protein [unclassified Pseudomonas]MDI3248538.1 hypothetical protein [Pseudomonas sp. AL10]MDI3264426.1 hypothetical protein [Pseudomonas sp. AL15]